MSLIECTKKLFCGFLTKIQVKILFTSGSSCCDLFVPDVVVVVVPPHLRSGGGGGGGGEEEDLFELDDEVVGDERSSMCC